LAEFRLELGVKTDPVQYRLSYPWLFRLLVDEGVRFVQLGTFFEIYQLPDEYFLELRRQAEHVGIEIASIFTAHRELGGFFIDEPGWEATARANYQRLIEVGAILGVRSVGSNPGAVLRDRMETKSRGLKCYLKHMKELLCYAHEQGVQWLTIEPMSCLAEPPTLPDEIAEMAEELSAFHRQHPDSTARIGFCTDIAHGYADSQLKTHYDHLQLLESTLPYLYEVHLKNTDSNYCSTFGFSPSERETGIVDLEPIRRMLLEHRDAIPVDRLIGYLEIGGPKLGRDYSDKDLAVQLRASLDFLKVAWPTDGSSDVRTLAPQHAARSAATCAEMVKVAPSVMCADLCHLGEGIRQLEAAGADILHFDMADGHFVPSLLLGMDVVRAVREVTSLPMDVHLMVEQPDKFVGELADIGVEMVSIHAEACRHLDRSLLGILDRGMKAGVALNPSTPLEVMQYVRERLDFVLLMTVNPGFSGQKLVASAIRKIGDCRRFLDAFGARKVEIMVDGNVSFENIPKMVAAGADILIAGTSSWFNSKRPLRDNVQETQAAIDRGLTRREMGE
jgi:ribulose-phosphate 3-epimerase